MRKNFYWLIISLARKNIVFRIIVDVSAFIFYRLFRRNKTFSFQGKKYHYFYHPYNRTIASERMVEIPIAKRVLDYYTYKGGKVLEVGNVLAHYFPVDHDVLDKYEKAPGVINQDVATVKLTQKYDLIISVSTMEHVGFSYGEKKDSRKFLKSINNLSKYLNTSGIIFITCPVFYNPFITELIKKRRMPFQKEYFMKRVSFWNEWKEVDFDKAIQGNAYDKYFANANDLYIGILSSNNEFPHWKFINMVHPSKTEETNLTGQIKRVHHFIRAFYEDLI